MTDQLLVCESCGMTIHSGPCKIATPYKKVAEEIFYDLYTALKKAEKLLGVKFSEE